MFTFDRAIVHKSSVSWIQNTILLTSEIACFPDEGLRNYDVRNSGIEVTVKLIVSAVRPSVRRPMGSVIIPAMLFYDTIG